MKNPVYPNKQNSIKDSIHESVNSPINRRQFVRGIALSSIALAVATHIPSAFANDEFSAIKTANKNPKHPVLIGSEFNLTIGEKRVNITGKPSIAKVVNNSLPAPTLVWQEGDIVTIHVKNELTVSTSLHWHGIILPTEMDGVPGFSFDGIKPGETFTYQFKVQQNGTYWYHSHTGYQEQSGVYGSIVILPKDPQPIDSDYDFVIQLSDWSDTSPETIYANLKKMGSYYNFSERTVGDFWNEVKQNGFFKAWNNRKMWNDMRMSDRDISDVTGATYTYLMNGLSPNAHWRTVVESGKKVRLRFINSSAMTFFDIRIPGLKIKIVAADGNLIQPIEVDEFRMGVAEVYDVIIEPDTQKQPYAIFAQAIDRSGYAIGSITSDPNQIAETPKMDPNQIAETPKMDPKPILTTKDMGMSHNMSDMKGMEDMSNMDMNHSSHDMSGMKDMGGMDMSHSPHDMSGMKDMGGMDMSHSAHDMSGMKDMGGMDMSHSPHDMSDMKDMGGMEMSHSAHDMSGMKGMNMDHSSHDMSDMKGMHSSYNNPQMNMEMDNMVIPMDMNPKLPQINVPRKNGPQIDMRSMGASYQLDDPGVGLRNNGRKVLTYADLKNLYPTRNEPKPTKELILHLTGNMERYMWSIDGIPFDEAPPLKFKYGERIRITFINDTMMNHPMHLHGLWSDLENGDENHIPRKHTIIVQPGSKISYRVTMDAKGDWAFHCHMLYHMMGMYRRVQVR